MPASRGRGGLGQKEISGATVAIIAVVGVVALLCVVFFVFIKPGMDSARAAKEWTSPEAAAARAPENRQKDPSHEAFVAELRNKERGGNAAGEGQPAGRRRRRDD